LKVSAWTPSMTVYQHFKHCLNLNSDRFTQKY